MAKIEVLSPHVADLIAAGEVVERPGSVVKELLENSIDAGAFIVTVEIKNSGMSYIRVTDNGCGMAPDDAESAFLRHATSKLRDERGLEAIGTLGFRGEALAAIAAVSRIHMVTREEGRDSGTELALEGGSVLYKRPAGCPTGTTITVSDLFFNTPARLKFMKSDKAEGANVSAVVQRVAMSHPEVSIRYIKDGKQEYHTPGDGRVDSCVYSILGRDFASSLLEVTGVDSSIPVTGYITAPVNSRGNRNYQFFYVNGRYVKSKTLQAALEQAYKNSLFTGRFPGCVLYIDLGLGSVDVNVHPAKTEVKFLNEKQVFDAVYYSVLAALGAESKKAEIELSSGTRAAVSNGFGIAPAQEKPEKGGRDDLSQPSGGSASRKPDGDFFKTMQADSYRALFGGISHRSGTMPLRNSSLPQYDTTYGVKAGKSDCYAPSGGAQNADGGGISAGTPLEGGGKTYESNYPSAGAEDSGAAASADGVMPDTGFGSVQGDLLAGRDGGDWRIIGEALSTYIIVERGDSIFLIDKHAAHERMLFDKLKRETGAIMSQQLLTPMVLSMDRESAAALSENAEYLENFGFEIGEFGDGRILLRALPADIAEDEIPSLLAELAEKLASGHRANPDELRDELLHSVACRAAIKAGKYSPEGELEPIVREVMSGRVRYCPHGRPVSMEITRATLDKNFKRI